MQERLQLYGWLDDDVLNTYAERLFQTAETKAKEKVEWPVCILSTFLLPRLKQDPICGYRYHDVRRWTKRAAQNLALKDFVVVPIHQNLNHWTVVVMAIRQEKILYYDSWPVHTKAEKKKRFDIGSHVMETLARFLRDDILTWKKREKKEKKASDKTCQPLKWSHIIVESSPKQNNGSDCGVFVAEIMSCYFWHTEAMTLPALDFGPQDIPLIRQRLAQSLL